MPKTDSFEMYLNKISVISSQYCRVKQYPNLHSDE